MENTYWCIGPSKETNILKLSTSNQHVKRDGSWYMYNSPCKPQTFRQLKIVITENFEHCYLPMTNIFKRGKLNDRSADQNQSDLGLQ